MTGVKNYGSPFTALQVEDWSGSHSLKNVLLSTIQIGVVILYFVVVGQIEVHCLPNVAHPVRSCLRTRFNVYFW